MAEENATTDLESTGTAAGALVQQLADTVLKYLPLLGVTFYGLGLVVVNLYLVQFGVTDFSIFKPQCIITGIWAALLLVLAGFPALSWCRAIEKHWNEKTGARTIKAIKLYFASLAGSTAFAAILALVLGLGRSTSFSPFAGWFILVAVMSLPLVGVIPGRGGPSPRSAYAALCAGFGLVGFFAIMLVTYAIYPYVDADRGGGRPVHAVFFFTKDGQELTSSLMKQQIATNPAQSPNALGGDLIYANAQFFLVRFDFDTAVRETKKPVEIERRLVNAYIPDDAPPAGEGR